MAYLAPPSSPDLTFNLPNDLTVHRVTNTNDEVLHSTPIHTLNDDVLLNIFYFCQPLLLNGDEAGTARVLQGGEWIRERWWYKPAQVQDLQRLLVAICEEFPMLEYLYIGPPAKYSTGLTLPQTFRAPHLRHFVLSNFAFPIGSPLLATPMDLVTLSLQNIHPFVYFRPNALLQRLALMPLLETLQITFHSPPSDVQRQLLDTPIMTHITLLNLRWFAFGGTSAYVEALLPWITTPLLDKLQIKFFHQFTFSVPRLLQFMTTTENLKFSSATLAFYNEGISMRVYPHKGARMFAFYSYVTCIYLDWQVASAAQLFNALRTVFSMVGDLTLEYRRYSIPLEWRDEADRMRWRELLRSFSNVKSLHVDDGLVRELSRSLQIDYGESPLELLPELKELSYIASGDFGDIFTPFINARRNAGHPVTLIRYNLGKFCEL
ncbi:hypothetical protein BJV74DRAFT_796458 [Russula compacta]|nr:hypothetical protein BJV74DRAFT_796458 [Russula compacta]